MVPYDRLSDCFLSTIVAVCRKMSQFVTICRHLLQNVDCPKPICLTLVSRLSGVPRAWCRSLQISKGPLFVQCTTEWSSHHVQKSSRISSHNF
jgi:hypothetical protein